MVVAVAVERVSLSLKGPESFPAFYEAMLPRMLGYFLRRCGGVVPVAEDLTQETFLAAVRELKRRRTVDAPIPWLYGIARHKLLDHYRWQGQTRVTVVPWDDESAANLDLVQPTIDLGGDPYDRVVELLARLPTDQRTVLVLRYLDGLSVPDVAAAVGKSLHAVESLLARGRANFKRTLAESEVGHG